MSIRRQQQQLCFKIKPDGLKNFDWAAVVSTNEYLDRKKQVFCKRAQKSGIPCCSLLFWHIISGSFDVSLLTHIVAGFSS